MTARWLIAVVAAWPLSGCTGLEPAALSAGTSVAQTGVTFFDRGKARTVEYARYGDTVAAVKRTGEKLSLRLHEEACGDARARLAYRDDRGKSLVVVVERRTATISLLQADAGAFGEIGVASLFINQTVEELKTPPSQQGSP